MCGFAGVKNKRRDAEGIYVSIIWTPDDFLHQFKIHSKSIGVLKIHGPEYSQSAQAVKLSDLALRINQRFLYEYNFFVNWQLEVRVEKAVELNKKRTYPLCLVGKRAAPPEDCGGPDHFIALRDHFSPS